MTDKFMGALAALIIAGAAAPALAHPGHDHSAAAPQTAEGQGVVKGVDAKGASITVAHGPIAALKWPAMTMTFRTASPAVVNGIKVGQNVHFVLKN
jgi:Cu/Ag efflux protein CusF